MVDDNNAGRINHASRKALSSEPDKGQHNKEPSPAVNPDKVTHDPVTFPSGKYLPEDKDEKEIK